MSVIWDSFDLSGLHSNKKESAWFTPCILSPVTRITEYMVHIVLKMPLTQWIQSEATIKDIYQVLTWHEHQDQALLSELGAMTGANVHEIFETRLTYCIKSLRWPAVKPVEFIQNKALQSVQITPLPILVADHPQIPTCSRSASMPLARWFHLDHGREGEAEGTYLVLFKRMKYILVQPELKNLCFFILIPESVNKLLDNALKIAAYSIWGDCQRKMCVQLV